MSAEDIVFTGLCLLLVAGLSTVLRHLRVRCYWQSTGLYRRAGLFVCIGGRRYWVIRTRGV